MILSWNRVEWKAWKKSCKVCVLKRGWTKADLAEWSYLFFCVHQTDETGSQRICAGDKKKAQQFAKEQFGKK